MNWKRLIVVVVFCLTFGTGVGAVLGYVLQRFTEEFSYRGERWIDELGVGTAYGAGFGLLAGGVLALLTVVRLLSKASRSGRP
jgi:membrane protein YqaA with SNARE-associated domain